MVYGGPRWVDGGKWESFLRNDLRWQFWYVFCLTNCKYMKYYVKNGPFGTKKCIFPRKYLHNSPKVRTFASLLQIKHMFFEWLISRGGAVGSSPGS